MRALGKSLGQVTLKKLLWGRWVRNLRSPVMSLSASLTSLSLQGSDRNAVFSAPLFLSPGDKRLSMLAGIHSGVSLWLFLVRKILELQPVPQEVLLYLSLVFQTAQTLFLCLPVGKPGPSHVPLIPPTFSSTYSARPSPSVSLNRLLSLWGALPQDTLSQP